MVPNRGWASGRLFAAALLLWAGLLPGCGSGGSNGAPGQGVLSFRARWVGASSVADPNGGFGEVLPASVQTARVVYTPTGGEACCVAFDPRDPIFSNQRRLVISDLAPGAGSFTLSGYPTAYAPADGVGRQCTTEPPAAGHPCTALSATASFRSDSQDVTITAGQQTVASNVLVRAVPFLVPDSIEPAPGATIDLPFALRFTVANAIDQVLPESIAAQIAAGTGGPTSASIGELTPCSDGTTTPCSAGGALEVSGYRVVSEPQSPASGAVTATITALNAGGEALRFEYGFVTLPAGASPTASSPATDTPTTTATAIPTATATASSTLPPTPTATQSPTETRVPTEEPTRSATATESATAVPTRTPTGSATGTPTPSPSSTATVRATGTPTPTSTSTATLGPTIGVLSGTVVSCLTGAPLNGATVSLTGPAARQQDTLADGGFDFQALPLGTYQVHGTADGFLPNQVQVELGMDNPAQDISLALCPVDQSALRIVLTWGSGPPAPADLDSHLRGPAPGTSVAGQPVEFHVFWENPNIPFADGSEAVLDIDDVSYSGPETITVSQLTAGEYRYCVHDFSDSGDATSTALGSSEARVQVFLAGAQAGDFQVPAGAGTVWEVFRVEVGQGAPTVVPVGTLGASDNSELVCARPDDPDGDGLTNAQEQALGTNPLLYDTNGNGVSDGQDVINASLPQPASVRRVSRRAK